MKAEHFGISFVKRPAPQVGRRAVHDPELTDMESAALEAIRVHNQRPIGPAIPADVLARWLDISERELRTLINHLIDRRYHGLPIFSRAGADGGYFLATEQETLREWAAVSARAHMRRALTGLQKAREMGASAAELAQGVVQLTLGLNQSQAQELGHDVIDSLAQAGIPVSLQAVKRALARYASNPARYQKEIQELARQYGGLFVRREQLEKILREKTAAAVDATMAALKEQEPA